MKHHYPCFLILLFLTTFFQVKAQVPAPVFASKTFARYELAKSADKALARLGENTYLGYSRAYFQFSSIPSDAQRQRLLENGIHIGEYIPEHVYLLSIPAHMPHISRTLMQCGVIALLAFDDEKVDAEVRDKYFNTEDMRGYKIPDIETTVQIYYYDDISLKEISGVTGTIVSASETLHRVRVVCKRSTLNYMIGNAHWIKYIVLPPPAPSIVNLPGKTNHRSAIIGSAWGRNLQGDSVIIGEWDGAGVGKHLDVDSPRVTAFDKYTNNLNGQHATHVAGTMAGSGAIDPFATGMAPNARVYSRNFDLDIPAQMDTVADSLGMMITQNSYGYGDPDDPCPTRGQYDDVSRDLDKLVRKYPYLVHVFAAGNSQSACGLGGYRTVFSGFQAAKNEITVGALDANDNMSGFSSWGPVRDGRLKPEVCAVGVNVYSCQNLNLYAGGWNGTSMACPGTSGTVAQVYQRYHQLNGGVHPQASLIRVVMANTADDILNAGPDFKSGYGRINGLNAVKALEQQRYKIDSINNGALKVDSVYLGTGLLKWKVALAWTDKEAASLATKALVNNLDLYVITPIGDTVRPWKLDTLNRNNLAYRGIDSINNLEQVTIDTPAAGYYKIYVKGTAVPTAPQVYATTWEPVNKGVTVIFPNGGESLIPGNTYQIRWDAYFSGTSNANIEYSLNNGATWTTITVGTNLALKTINWTVPNVSSSMARIRINGALSDMSDSTFVIMKTTSAISGVVCDKQVTLKWNSIAGVSDYDVMQIINGYMQKIGTSTDTFYTVTGLTNGKAYWFTVRGRFGTYLGERAKAVSFTPAASPLPPLVVLQPQSQTRCSGVMAVFTSRATGTASITQQWQISYNGGSSFTSIPGATDTLLTFPVNTLYNGIKIRCYYYNPCQSFVYTDTATLTVDTVIQYALQPQNKTICSGNNVQFVARVLTKSTPVYQWQYNDGINGWLNITGATDSVLNLTSVSYAFNGYKYRLLTGNQCSSNVSSSIATLTVRPPLDVTGNGRQTICIGASATLSATATGGDAARYAFIWKRNGTILQALHTSSITVSPTSTQTYVVVLIDSCSNVADSDTVTVNVRLPLQVSTATYKAICKGTSVKLTATGAGGNGNYSYRWMQGSTVIQNTTLNSITVSPTSTTTYRVVLSDNCTTNSDSLNILVLVRNPLSVSATYAPDSACFGQNITVNATGNGGDSTYIFTFVNGITKAILQSGTASSITTPLALSSSIWVVLSDQCTPLNDTVKLVIPIRNKLSAKINGPTLACANKPVQLSAAVTGGKVQSYTYQWQLQGNPTVLGTSSTLTITPTGSSDYVLTVSDGCSPVNSQDILHIDIDRPDPSFQMTNSGLGYAFFYPTRSGLKAYHWDFGDGSTTTEFQPNHKYKRKGTYNVCLKVTTFNDCDSQICENLIMNFPDGIQTLNGSGITVQPNPFTQGIEVNLSDLAHSTLNVFDVTGRMMYHAENVSAKIQIETTNWAPGTYLMQVISGTSVYTLKLIRE